MISRRLLIFSLAVFLFLGAVFMAVAGSNPQTGICGKIKPCQLLVQADAERILGQSARLTGETSRLKDDVRQCVCAYTGVSTDRASGESSLLFFSLEEKEAQPSAEEAKQVMMSTKKANEHDTEIVDLKGIGDEAFLLSNDSNSHLIMARRGAIILRLQVKRAAGSKSLEEVKAFAERVSKNL